MEDDMIGTEVILTLLVTRIILPVSLLLLVGEWVHRRERTAKTRR
jgi:hypothetical protein